MESLSLGHLARTFDLQSGLIDGATVVTRRLSDLQGIFADELAYQAALALGNPIIYTVASVEAATGDGQLHYGLGTLMPGKIGDEFYCTKGHLHAWRPAAEVYIGLQGEGAMLLERTGETRLEPIGAGRIVYVPGFTAHRTINTGDVPLVYLGVYDSAAGHDYGAIASSNFQALVVAQEGQPTLLQRGAYLVSLAGRRTSGF